MLITDLINAARAGQELANAEKWKKGQAIAGPIAVLIVSLSGIAAYAGYGVPVPLELANTIGLGVAAIVVLLNSYITLATTKRIGLPPQPDDIPAAGPDGGGHGEDAVVSEHRPTAADAPADASRDLPFTNVGG